jgi:hypothetical protein
LLIRELKKLEVLKMNHFPAKYKAKGDRGTKLAAVKVTTTVPL